MNSRDIAKLSADSEMHKKHKKRTKKIKAQLLEQVMSFVCSKATTTTLPLSTQVYNCVVFLTMSMVFEFQTALVPLLSFLHVAV